MNADELKEKIAARKKEAEDKKISHHIWYVLHGLGQITENGNSNSNDYESKGHFDNKNGLVIEYSSFFQMCSDGGSGGSSTEVKFNGKRVYYNAGAGLDCYLPGSWENILFALSAEGEKAVNLKKLAEQAKQEAIEAKKIQDEAKKWGL